MSYENFVQVRLASVLASGATSATLTAPTGANRLPPADGGRLILADVMGSPSFTEVISYTSRTGNTLNGLVRGLEGTAAREWGVGSYCYQSLTAAEFQAVLDSLILKAPLDSAPLTGNPTAPTPAVDTNTNQLQTAAGVLAQLTAIGLNGGVAALGMANMNSAPLGRIVAYDGYNGDAATYNWPTLAEITAGTPVWWNVFTFGAEGRKTQIALQAYEGPGPKLFIRQWHDNKWTPSWARIALSSAVESSLSLKVDKVSGKGLSTNDLTAALLNKLNGIAAGATVNATDAALRDRSSHTGTQPVSSITGLGWAALEPASSFLRPGHSQHTHGTYFESGAPPGISHIAGSGNADNVALTIANSGNQAASAVIQFHRQGSHASYFGLDIDNVFKVGGRSMGDGAWALWHDQNGYDRARTAQAQIGGNWVGGYIFARNGSAGTVGFGATIAGSSLFYSNTGNTGGVASGGSYRCMGECAAGHSSLFLRIA